MRGVALGEADGWAIGALAAYGFGAIEVSLVGRAEGLALLGLAVKLADALPVDGSLAFGAHRGGSEATEEGKAETGKQHSGQAVEAGHGIKAQGPGKESNSRKKRR